MDTDNSVLKAWGGGLARRGQWGDKGTYVIPSTLKIFKYCSLEIKGPGVMVFNFGRSVPIITHTLSREGKSWELNPECVAAIPGHTVFLK